MARVSAQLSWIFVLVPATFLLAAVPDGHLLSRDGGRCLVRRLAVCIAGSVVGMAIIPGPLDGRSRAVNNPLGVERRLIEVARDALTFLLVVGVVLRSASLRRSGSAGRPRRRERQQMKWIAFSGAAARRRSRAIVDLAPTTSLGAVAPDRA